MARVGIINELRKLDVLNDEIKAAANTLNTIFTIECYTLNAESILIIDTSKVCELPSDISLRSDH